MMMALFVVTRLQQKKCYIDAISNKVFKLQNLMVYNELLQVRKMEKFYFLTLLKVEEL